MKAFRAKLHQRGKEIPNTAASPSMQAPSSEFEPRFLPKDLLFFQKLPRRSGVPDFELPEKYGVRGSLPSRVRHGDEGLPYVLGSGISCTVVQHETGPDTASIVPAGTIVALKKYVVDDPGNLWRSQNMRAPIQTIWHDMRIHCHPYFRDHENFCRLLYLGWEYGSLIPVLALELADYGTLATIMQSEQKMSVLQKSNISMDIAAGVWALHFFGFVHGDLKPSNILLQHHSDRQIIAKLIDFSGVVETYENGQTAIPSFVTPTWLAPEVFSATIEVDWQKVDVYSFGLLLAQIWYDRDMDLLDSFLETQVPKECPPDNRRDFMLYYKICPDEDPESALSQALRAVSDTGLEIYGESSGPLKTVLRKSVTRDPSARLRMNQIIPYFANLGKFCNRTWRDPSVIDYNADYIPNLASYDSDWLVFGGYEDRSDEHQRLTLNYMLQLSRDPVLSKTRFIKIAEEDVKDPVAMAHYLLANIEILEDMPDDELYWRSIHFQIAISYFRGFGTTMDEQQGLRFLASSALGGVRRAMGMFNSLESSCTFPLVENLPRMLFLLFGYFENCSETADLLRTRYPLAFKAAQKLHAGMWSFGPGLPMQSTKTNPLEREKEIQQQERELRPHMHNARSTLQGRLMRICSFNNLKEDPWKSILIDSITIPMLLFFFTLELEDVELLTSMVQSEDFAECRNPGTGPSPMHMLAYLEDKKAAALVKVFVESGIRLDLDYIENWTFHKNRVCMGRSWPLIWAVVKDRPLFFEALLKQHIEKRVEISSELLEAVVATIARYRQPRMIWSMVNMGLVKPGLLREPIVILHALNLGLGRRTLGDMIGLRWGRGDAFKSAHLQILEILLEHGADPLSISRSDRTVLEEVILHGEGGALAVICKSLQARGADLSSLLGSKGVCSHTGPWVSRSSMIASLVACNGSAFIWILENFPNQMFETSIYNSTPLIRAAQGEQLFWAAQLLLRKDAELCCYDDMGFSPLTNALAIGNIHTAELLVSFARAQGKLDLLLKPNPVNGYTAFGILLKTFTAGRKQKLSLAAFEFIWALGGATFILNENEEDTAWRVFFRKGRSTKAEYQAADMILLDFLLRPELFHSHIDDTDWTGRTPLQYASYRGNIDAVTILLDKGASVNKQSTANTQFPGKVGLTALDFAVVAYSGGVPTEIKVGGFFEVAQWQQRMEAIIRDLVRRGGECGPNYSKYYQIWAEKIANPESWPNVYVRFQNAQGDETWKADWPRPVPACPSSSNPTPNPDEQLIIHRNRRGKKYKLTPMLLTLIEPFLEDSTGPEDIDDMQAFQMKMLRVKACINSYMSLRLKYKSGNPPNHQEDDLELRTFIKEYTDQSPSVLSGDSMRANIEKVFANLQLADGELKKPAL